MTAFRITPGPLATAFHEACARLDRIAFADALWGRRLDVWTGDAAAQRLIANRLGWLGTLDFLAGHLPRLRAFAESIKSEPFTDVVLLGMGGSSLAPEVLRQVLGVADGSPRFRVLDSIDPDAVRETMDAASRPLFILASKSGSTIEPNVMAAEAQRRVAAAGAGWASHFVAITDPDTALHRRATADRFRDVFVNPPDIGGRYSALSLFGMVPAALMGADLDRILAAGREMETACRRTSCADNPGLALGALMAAGAMQGRDKLTLLLPPRLQALGLWIEQLVAESTGKQGKGIVPITGEGPGAALSLDRVLVSLTLGADADAAQLAETNASGTPLAELHMSDVNDIGAEFLRWEVATAAAGVLLGINPFDEPNVQQAKDATRALLDVYRTTRHIPMAEPHGAIGGARLTLSRSAQEHLGGAAADAFLTVVRPSDYVGVLAYLPPDRTLFDVPLQEFRSAAARQTSCATMFGYGPRYLHSTGQLHKGGANNGVFVILTAEPATDLPIPGEPFSFGVLEMAQAIGDFQSLDRAGRRALHVHLPSRDVDLLRRVTTALSRPVSSSP
jgi:transaldolase / glucose-6-phosphate isomerase